MKKAHQQTVGLRERRNSGTNGNAERAYFSEVGWIGLLRLELGGSGEWQEWQALAAYETIGALMNDIPKPGREGCRLAEAAELLVCLDKRLLRRVLSQMRIADNCVRHCAGEPLKAHHQLTEGV
jgi:hypothetical protein